MRQFVCSQKPRKDGSVIITGKDYLYLSRSLRLRIGDVIDVSFADGGLCAMQAQSITKKEVVLVKAGENEGDDGNRAKVQGVVAGKVQNALEGVPEYWLFQFLPKTQKMDQIVRQATECGVHTIVPVISEFTVRGSEPPRTERWERIIKEARQQSGSPVPTRILEAVDVHRALELWAEACKESGRNRCGFVLHEDPAYGLKALIDAADGTAETKSAALAVGCEGGISPAELEALYQAGFQNVHFETNVLRAETAAIYGLAVLQQLFAYKK